MCLPQTLVEKVLAERESGRVGGGHTISWQLDVVPLVDAYNALRAEVDTLRDLLDAKSHEAGLYARRMEQAQRSRDEARAEERDAVVAWLRRKATDDFCALRVKEACDAEKSADAIEAGEHRREEEP